MREEKTPKYSVEIKQSRKGHYYLGSLKINADSEIEMERLMDSALSSVMYKIRLLNESRRKVKKNQTERQIYLSDPNDKRLFEKLRQLRYELSQTEKLPAYMIFHDSTLKEIALRRPFKKEQLFQISGIGLKKYEKYGENILKIVNEFIANNQGKEIGTSVNTENLNVVENMKRKTENFSSKVLLQGSRVKIQQNSSYNGEIGKIVGYDGFKYYKIELMGIKKIIKCLETEIEKATDEDIKKYIVEIRIDNNKILKLKVQNLKPSIDSLKDNQVLKGLYALGKYYSLQNYPELHKSDYFSQKIIELKSMNKHTAKKIAEIFLNFINRAEELKTITNRIDYIVMMPTTKETNHVSLWGEKISETLDIENITKYIYIKPEKVEYLSNYVHKDLWGRKLTANGAFKINKADPDFPLLTNKSCLILDDVCTTGNQINELTNLLAAEGIREVYAFVIGKTKFG